MNTSKSLKIWTIITHACIVVGWGHGILLFFFIEIISFPYFSEVNIGGITGPFETKLSIVGFLTLLGQLAIVRSLFIQSIRFKIIAQITGILLLWVSIFSYTYHLDNYSHFGIVTAIPFAVCTILTFTGGFIKNSWRRITQ